MKFYVIDKVNSFLFQRIVERFYGEVNSIEDYDGGEGIFIIATNQVHEEGWPKYVSPSNNLIYLLDDGPEGYCHILRTEYTRFYGVMDENGVDRNRAIISYNNSIKKGINHYSDYNLTTLYTPTFLLQPFNEWMDMTEEVVPQYDYSYLVRNGKPHKEEAYFKIKEKNLNILLTYKENRTWEDDSIIDANKEGLLDEFQFHLKPEFYYYAKINFTVESEYLSFFGQPNWFDHMMHLSEKTYRNISYGLPFVLISNKNSLKHLREFGFKTFDCFIDESYDSMDDDKRMDAAIDAGIELLKYFDDPMMKEILKYNKSLIYNDEKMGVIFNNYVIAPLKEYVFSLKNNGQSLI